MEKVGYKDGEYQFSDVADCLNKDFESEKALCDYIESHIQEFCDDCLGVKYLSHKREEKLSDVSRSVRGNRRIDFVIVSQTGERIGVEAKCPSTPAELSYAIGQSLCYMTLFEQMGKPLSRMIILSTKIDSVLPAVINRYNLPIGFICFDKSKFLTYVRTEIKNGRK